MMIDDFTSGPYTATLASGVDEHWQATGSPHFPGRFTKFQIISPPSGHIGSLVVGPGDLSVATGPDMTHKLEVVYGRNKDGSPSYLNQNLSHYGGFRVNFLFNDNTLNFNIIYYSRSGAVYSNKGRNVTPLFTPSSVDFPFSDFLGGADPGDVDLIVPTSIGAIGYGAWSHRETRNRRTRAFRRTAGAASQAWSLGAQ